MLCYGFFQNFSTKKMSGLPTKGLCPLTPKVHRSSRTKCTQLNTKFTHGKKILKKKKKKKSSSWRASRLQNRFKRVFFFFFFFISFLSFGIIGVIVKSCISQFREIIVFIFAQKVSSESNHCFVQVDAWRYTFYANWSDYVSFHNGSFNLSIIFRNGWWCSQGGTQICRCIPYILTKMAPLHLQKIEK